MVLEQLGEKEAKRKGNGIVGRSRSGAAQAAAVTKVTVKMFRRFLQISLPKLKD